MVRIILLITAIAAVVALGACATTPPPTPTPIPPTLPTPTAVPPTQAPPTQAPATSVPTTSAGVVVGLPNPASVYCEQHGGKLEIRKDPKDGEVGYCVFPDKSECEEWAYMRGECKPGTRPTTAGSFTDPFAYCSAVGNVDTPDARYAGVQPPDAIVRGLHKAMGLAPDARLDQLARLTKWRCMGGQVYACSLGANIPCDEKADTNKTPTVAMNDYCKVNASSDFIPAVVTGHATVYEWKCTSGNPAIVKQLTQPDARGFLSTFWYEIKK